VARENGLNLPQALYIRCPVFLICSHFLSLLSVGYRWFSGAADFGLWPRSGLEAWGRLSVTLADRVLRKFLRKSFQAADGAADAV
jgi:hypothetical protein